MIRPFADQNLQQRLGGCWRGLVHFRWRAAVHALLQHFRDDHLAVTAGSLTFTTTMALVPLLTVVLAIFTAFPIFSRVQGGLQKWLLQSLVPDNIARQVMGYLTQFASHANRLGWFGVGLLLLTALSLILTIDHTLNGIWRVHRRRALGQRLLVYWAALTLGPLLLGLSLSVSSYALSAAKGIVDVMPDGIQRLLDWLEFGLLAWAMAALYHFVPNTQVKWAHAWSGALLVAIALEAAKAILAWYWLKVPSYALVYGTFATLPILLVWIYVAWLIVLLGAVLVADLPNLLSGVEPRGESSGLAFELALEVLQQLDAARRSGDKGLSLAQLGQRLRVETFALEPVLEALAALDWLGQLSEESVIETARYVLLVDPGTTPLAPLLRTSLLADEGSARNLWQHNDWQHLLLRDALAPCHGD